MKVFVLLFTIFLSIGSNVYQKNPQDCYESINADDFYLYMNQDSTVVLDVREYKEYKKNRISDARSIPNKKFLLEYCKNLDKQTIILVYCEMGITSKTVSKILCNELKFTNVYNLNQGLETWIMRGYDIDNSRIKKK